MSNQHTPGPWHYTESTDTIYSDTEAHIACMVPSGYATAEKLRSNSRLIIAAPDLMSALQRLLGLAECEYLVSATDGAERVNHAIDQARAAISKAKSTP